MNTNQHTSAKGLNYFISVKFLILGTNVSQRPWSYTGFVVDDTDGNIIDNKSFISFEKETH